jgi:hypothetical protein
MAIGTFHAGYVTASKRSHNLHETYQLPRVQLIIPDDGLRRYQKHVEFYDKINFGYLMHLVGVVLYEDYHDARSFEHKVRLIEALIFLSYKVYLLLANPGSQTLMVTVDVDTVSEKL